MPERSSGSPNPVSAERRAEDDIRRVLESVVDVRLAVLFGSVARETAGSGSDLDVGVSLRDRQRADLLPELRVALERATGRVVDLICLDEAPPLVHFEIARGGRVLLQRSPYDWADFRARAMIDWWDWAPTARMVRRTVARRSRRRLGMVRPEVVGEAQPGIPALRTFLVAASRAAGMDDTGTDTDGAPGS